MNQGLFESLTGHFLDETPLEAIAPQRRRVVSIMDHLGRMFNTRQGSLSHMSDYGLPDVSEIYRKMPDGIEELQSAIKNAIERYEPRLINVRVVKREPEEGNEFRLMFILSGELAGGGGLVRFQTTFTSIGKSSIAPWKRPE